MAAVACAGMAGTVGAEADVRLPVVRWATWVGGGGAFVRRGSVAGLAPAPVQPGAPCGVTKPLVGGTVPPVAGELFGANEDGRAPTAGDAGAAAVLACGR